MRVAGLRRPDLTEKPKNLNESDERAYDVFQCGSELNVNPNTYALIKVSV